MADKYKLLPGGHWHEGVYNEKYYPLKRYIKVDFITMLRDSSERALAAIAADREDTI